MKEELFGIAMDPSSESFLEYVRKGKFLETKSLTSLGEDGSIVVPSTFDDRIQQKLLENGSIRSLANKITITTEAFEYLHSGKGPDIGWVGETAARETTSAPDLIKKRINVFEMYAKPRATQKLLDDSAVDLESWMAESIAGQISRIENNAFLYGEGNHKPNVFLAFKLSFNLIYI
jgi:HK97 family phage major capsid protein